MTALAILALSIGYSIVGLIVARLAAGHFAHSMRLSSWERDRSRYSLITSRTPPSSPNGEQWFGAICLALPLGLVWPCAFILLARLPAIGAEARHRLNEREAHIERLEQLLGVER